MKLTLIKYNGAIISINGLDAVMIDKEPGGKLKFQLHDQKDDIASLIVTPNIQKIVVTA